MDVFVDLTSRYLDMVHCFECDFDLCCDASSDFRLEELQEQIDNNLNLKLNHDIELLKELSFNLRHGICKIVEVKENNYEE